jgi:CRP-like cAMP-binding protein
MAEKSIPDDTLWGNVFHKKIISENNIYQVLAGIPIFEDLNRKELRAIERILHKRNYKENEILFHEGDPGVGMYIIEQGRVNITLGKEEKLLAVLSDKEFFGEIALLSETPRTATATAVTNSSILGFFQPDMMDLMETNPRMGNKFLLKLARMIGDRLRFSNLENQQLKTKISNLEEKSSRKRIS